jgi:hypothetical protein
MLRLRTYSGSFVFSFKDPLLFQKDVSPFNRVSPTLSIHGPNSNEVHQ